GRCAGGIRASFTSEVHVTLMMESIRRWIRWSKEVPGIEFHQDGYLWLLTSEEEVKLHENLMKLHNTLGVPTRMLYGEEVKEVAPTIKLNDVLGALHDPTAGKASPFHTISALRRELIAGGVKIFEYVKVRKLIEGSGRVKALEFEGGGEVGVEGHVVVGAGYQSRELLKSLGYEVPVVGDPHHLMITEKVAPFLKPLVIHKASGSYVNQVPSGGVIIGTEFPVPENDLRLRFAFIEKAVKNMAKYFPQILSANLLRVWIGYYLKTPDHHPIIGLLPHHDNLLVATGFSGHGYMMAPIVGEELASIIHLGKPRNPETEKLRPSRFQEGKLLEEKAVFG
ncbi:MAG: FAD-binding oxidoreductase, partial [Desulfurococcales archaeon]|nr:FAD-binding oxidoreductase [Desulfurococcales archaeon]